MGKIIASGVFIVRKDGKLLIAHPTNHPADFWSIPKGRVDDGETFLEGAIRECKEECNVDLEDTKDFNILPIQSVNYKTKKKILYPFLFLQKKESKLDCDKLELKCNSMVEDKKEDFPEMDDFKWVTLDEAKDLLHETQVACLDKIKALIGKQSVTY
jgi:ADP-ribose pyrophosphatase YjhB (NUDIX family)